MSEEELQNEEENKEENNEENKEENKEENNEQENEEKNDEINPEENNNEINAENEEQQEQQEQEQEQQEQEQEQEQEKENVEIDNDNKEEEKENANENNEQNDNKNNILKETEENDIKNELNALNDNNINNINNNNDIEQEINIIDNNKQNLINNDINIINNINQENGQQIINEEDNKELTILTTKKITADNLLSFGKNEFVAENTINTNGFGYNEKKSTQQILNEINNDMDLLEKDLNPIFNKYQTKKNFYNDYNGNYDEQDQEIKKLIEKANKLVNKHSCNTYGTKSEYNGIGNKYYNGNNISENGGNSSNYSERNDYSSTYDNNSDNSYKGYIRNISPEKDINKHRIKNISNIYKYNNNHRNYKEKKPLIYRQSETIHIKNSYMNKFIGQPQTYKKTHFSNNLVFSSDKISYRNIKYCGNINQSLDILFSNKK